MTHQVALSNEAYGALQREKQSAESFSQAVLRLLRAARRAQKDPSRFVARKRRHVLGLAEHLALVEADRDADRAGA